METRVSLTEEREVVTTKKVVDRYEVPALDLKVTPLIEISPNNKIFLNGILLLGATKLDFNWNELFGSFANGKNFGYVKITGPGWELSFSTARILYLKSEIPEGAKKVETVDV